MACNTKINTLNYLKTKKVIDENRRIISLVEFENQHSLLKKIAKDKYGITEDLFKVDKIKSKQPKGNEVTIFRVTPIDNIFEEMDSKINQEVYFEPLDYFEGEYTEGNIVPDYENYINYKKNLLTRLQNRLVKIESEKKKFASNPQVLKELSRLESDIKERVEGSPELGIKGLTQEIAELEKAPPIDKFDYYVQKDFKRLESLSRSENPEDLNEARVIIKFYKKLGTFDVMSENPIFKQEDIYDKEGNKILSKNVRDYFEKLAVRASDYDDIIHNKERNTIVNFVNSNEKVTDVYKDKSLSYNEIFYTEDGLKDISWTDMFIMDVTNGIFSHNGIIPQVMRINLQDSFENKLVWSKSVEKRVNDIQSRVEKELSKMGYSIDIPGVKGVSYDIFRSKDENDQYRDSIVQRYTPHYINERNKMLHEFDGKLKKAAQTEDPVQKQNLYRDANIFRDNWYKLNTVVLDIRKIPEIVEESSFKSFDNFFDKEDSNNYKEKLIDLLGEKGYEEEIEKQKKLIKNYQSMLEVFTDNIIVEYSVENYDSLPQEGKNKIQRWIKSNNPFEYVESYYSGNPISLGELKINSYMSYNYSVPRRNKIKLSHTKEGPKYEITGEDTGYYDENFEMIEDNPVLKEFHNLLSEVQQKIYETIPVESRNKFSAFSLPALRKNLTEILFDKNIPLLKRISNAARELYDRIKGQFGINPQDSLSYANIDPVTGRPEYQVNDSFLKSNKIEIDKRYDIELLRLKKELDIKLTDSLSKYDMFDITSKEQALYILAENLGIEPTLKALQQRLPNENLKKLEVGRILRDAITHQVVSEQSFDLPKIIKLYSHMAMEYSARQEALPLLEMMKRHYEEIKSPSVTNVGESVVNAGTNKTRLEGERVRAIKQMESFFQRAVLGNYESKNELGDPRIKRATKLGVTGNDKIDSLTSKLKTTITGRILDKDEKIIKSKIPDIIEKLSEIENNSKDPQEKGRARALIKRLSNISDKLGKQFSIAATFDALYNFIRFKGLGWNLSSYITNFMEGQIANITVAATGDYFNPENIYRATDIVKGSFVKNMSFGKYVTPGARLTRVLMDRYRILQDASNELQKASSKSAFSNFRSLSPYEGTRRTEYLNQAPLMLSVLMDIQIKSVNGEKTSSVFDAMNPDGTLKEEFRTDENIKNWEQAEGKAYNKFKNHITKTIVNAHGDYDELRGNMASEYILGKALLMFKRWMSRQFYQRWAVVPQTDLEVGVSNYKGRYFSHTQSSGFLHGAIIGFGGLGLLGAGPLGLVLGGGVGIVLGKLYGANTGMNFLQELAFNGKELALNLIRMPTNLITGKETIKSTDYSQLRLNDRDMRNMKANLVDMSITAAWLALLLFAKSLLWDDDDSEENENKRAAHNLIANRLMQLSSQAAMYLNPVETWDNTFGSVAIFRFMQDAGKTAAEAQDLLEGKDIIPSGPNAGESALYNQVSKTFFPGIIRKGVGFSSQAERQFVPSAFDSWFWGSEKIADNKIRALRAEYKNELKDNSELKEEDINEEVRKKYRYKRPNETYEDLLKEFNNG